MKPYVIAVAATVLVLAGCSHDNPPAPSTTVQTSVPTRTVTATTTATAPSTHTTAPTTPTFVNPTNSTGLGKG